MIGVDTNILVRYFTGDDEAQCAKVQQLMQRYEGVRGAFFINNTVVCEAVWTCARGYKYSKHQIISLLKAMLSTIEFQFEDEGLLWSASAECEKFSFADLPDVLIGLLNVSRGCKYTITFDKKASSLDGFKLL